MLKKAIACIFNEVTFIAICMIIAFFEASANAASFFFSNETAIAVFMMFFIAAFSLGFSLPKIFEMFFKKQERSKKDINASKSLWLAANTIAAAILFSIGSFLIEYMAVVFENFTILSFIFSVRTTLPALISGALFATLLDSSEHFKRIPYPLQSFLTGLLIGGIYICLFPIFLYTGVMLSALFAIVWTFSALLIQKNVSVKNKTVFSVFLAVTAACLGFFYGSNSHFSLKNLIPSFDMSYDPYNIDFEKRGNKIVLLRNGRDIFYKPLNNISEEATIENIPMTSALLQSNKVNLQCAYVGLVSSKALQQLTDMNKLVNSIDATWPGKHLIKSLRIQTAQKTADHTESEPSYDDEASMPELFALPQKSGVNIAKLADNYDFILLDNPFPDTFEQNYFLTKEFFSKLKKNHLLKDGILCISFEHVPETYRPFVLNALSEVFKDVILIDGVPPLAVASDSHSLTIDKAELGRRAGGVINMDYPVNIAITDDAGELLSECVYYEPAGEKAANSVSEPIVLVESLKDSFVQRTDYTMPHEFDLFIGIMTKYKYKAAVVFAVLYMLLRYFAGGSMQSRSVFKGFEEGFSIGGIMFVFSFFSSFYNTSYGFATTLAISFAATAGGILFCFITKAVRNNILYPIIVPCIFFYFAYTGRIADPAAVAIASFGAGYGLYFAFMDIASYSKKFAYLAIDNLLYGLCLATLFAAVFSFNMNALAILGVISLVIRIFHFTYGDSRT